MLSRRPDGSLQQLALLQACRHEASAADIGQIRLRQRQTLLILLLRIIVNFILVVKIDYIALRKLLSQLLQSFRLIDLCRHVKDLILFLVQLISPRLLLKLILLHPILLHRLVLVLRLLLEVLLDVQIDI